jgi:hypothetical protein
MNFDALRIRLDLINESVRRSRAAFLAATIASLSLIITAWNAYLSEYRSFPLDMTAFSGDEVTKMAQMELIKGWVGSLSFNIAPLGIRIGIADAAIVGSLGLYIIAVWMFFCVRRENRTVANLFFDMRRVEDPDLHELVYHAVTESMLFLSVRNDDEPLKSVDDVPRIPGKKAVLLRGSLRVLFYLPAIAAFSLLGFDVLSLFALPAAFRSTHQPLLLGHSLSAMTILKLIAMTAISTVVAISTLFVCQRIMAFEAATTSLIQENQPSGSVTPARE